MEVHGFWTKRMGKSYLASDETKSTQAGADSASPATSDLHLFRSGAMDVMGTVSIEAPYRKRG
jgi:hypothetical protein